MDSRVLQFDEQERNENLKALNSGRTPEQRNTTDPYETKFLISTCQKLAYLLSHWFYKKSATALFQKQTNL